jgi:HKD family nuclease
MSTPRPVATRPREDLLPTLRELLATADDAVLAMAFVDTRGIHLVGAELRDLGVRCRLVATSAFSGYRTHAAFTAATELGTRCKLFNPSRGTFHPKVIVAHRNGSPQALVGSANLTAGLVANVEAGVVVDGRPAEEISQLVESWWSDTAAVDWQPPGVPVLDVLDAGLWELVRGCIQPGDVITTLADGRPNTVVEVSRAGLWVETARSRRTGAGPQLVEPRMLDVAWAALLSDGELTNQRLLGELRVHRSSFVCALLARLPGVRVASRRPIRLVLDPARTAAGLGQSHLAAEARAPFDGRAGG